MTDNNSNIEISPGMSWYLNLVRGFAAIIVLLDHAGDEFFSQGFRLVPRISHEMVVIFFVLSGFLTSYSMTRGNSHPKKFFIARFSRIASVAYPALLLTIVCDSIGRSIAPDFYEEIAQSNRYWIRVLLNFFFLAQSGPLAAAPGSNVPFWFLNYQVWYYIILGFWSFTFNVRRRALLLLISASVAGPKILLLFPIYIAGAFAYFLKRHIKLRIGLSISLTAITFAILGLILTGNAVSWGYPAYLQIKPPFFFSTQFVSDNVLGLITATHIFAIDQLTTRIKFKDFSNFLITPVNFISDRSFSLYAFHMPLLYLVSVSFPYDKSNPGQVYLALSVVILTIFGLYNLTENKRVAWLKVTHASTDYFLNHIKGFLITK